jgi:hypothetical protein
MHLCERAKRSIADVPGPALRPRPVTREDLDRRAVIRAGAVVVDTFAGSAEDRPRRRDWRSAIARPPASADDRFLAQLSRSAYVRRSHRPFYGDVPGMDVVMDLGWIVTFEANVSNSTSQVSIAAEGQRCNGIWAGFRTLGRPPLQLRDPFGRLFNIVSHERSGPG